MGGGMSNKEIATELGISEHTAKFHVNAVMALMRTTKRTSAVVEALRLGVVALNDLPSATVKEVA
jgi:DNA-binding CsgD family transcriptional regulator